MTGGGEAPAIDPGHGLPELDFGRIGPPVGSRFPDVVLPDQSGARISLHEHRANRPALVVFHRSADW